MTEIEKARAEQRKELQKVIGEIRKELQFQDYPKVLGKAAQLRKPGRMEATIHCGLTRFESERNQAAVLHHKKFVEWRRRSGADVFIVGTKDAMLGGFRSSLRVVFPYDGFGVTEGPEKEAESDS